jgi:predicted regulator of Ras-like GTPase activity (Roadblock/LC7/MglB family)
MKEILEQLNATAGIRGSMVMTPDGIMAAAALGPDLEVEAVAALASALLVAMKKALRQLVPAESLSQLVLTASDGKMVFVDLGNAYLVVVAKRDVKLDTTMVEIRSAAHHIKNRAAHLVPQAASSYA